MSFPENSTEVMANWTGELNTFSGSDRTLQQAASQYTIYKVSLHKDAFDCKNKNKTSISKKQISEKNNISLHYFFFRLPDH